MTQLVMTSSKLTAYSEGRVFAEEINKLSDAVVHALSDAFISSSMNWQVELSDVGMRWKSPLQGR